MNHSLGIMPFKDFWMNCYFNMYFSILISKEPSYRLAAFLNDYQYSIYESETVRKTRFNGLMLNSMVNFHHQYLEEMVSNRAPINFKEDEKFSEYLKDLVRKNEVIFVGVDLYYWVPNSVCWNNYHWYHYSLINGFDEDKKVFYVLDDNQSGFDEHAIPEERFCTAIRNSTLNPHGFINKLPGDIGKFSFSISDVRTNAVRLAGELELMGHDMLWQMSDEDFDNRDRCDLFSMYLYQIVNRQKATQVLFQILQDKNEINSIESSNLMHYAADLENGWAIVRKELVRTYFSDNRAFRISEINEKCKKLFLKEYKMWNKFLSCTTA